MSGVTFLAAIFPARLPLAAPPQKKTQIALRNVFCYDPPMDVFAFNAADLMSFLLTLVRVSLLVFMLPFYGGDSSPMQVKAALCLVLALALWPNIGFQGDLFPANPWNLVLLVLGEVLLGMFFGLVMNIIFAGIQFGGEIIGFQMGFTMITLADPNSGGQMVATSYLMYMVSLMIFLTLDGHLHLLTALVDSFRLVPPGKLIVNAKLTSDIIAFSGSLFVVAFKIAGPIVAMLFLVELGLALMAKVAPQMNLLMIGMPLKIGLGFFFMGTIFTLMGIYMEEIIVGLRPLFQNILKLAGG